MEREEWNEGFAQCAVCGAAIAEGAEPSFAFAQQGVLCFECAIARGGEFDAPQDRWTASPDLAGLEEYFAERA